MFNKKTTRNKAFNTIFLCLFLWVSASAQSSKAYQLASPDGSLVVKIEAGAKLHWSIQHKGQPVLLPSPISLQLSSGEVLGNKVSVISAKPEKINSTINAIHYKKAVISDVYNALTLRCKGDYGVIFRAYNEGVAYRFFTGKKGELTVSNEEALFNFDQDYKCLIPFVRDLRGTEQYVQSFEALYDDINISQIKKDSLAFLPMLVNLGNEKKAVILEADLEDYPGMFVTGNASATNSIKGSFAPVVLAETQGGYNRLNTMATKRADYIAKVSGTRTFPWRVIVVSDNDAALANNDMVQRLAAPSRIADASWIKPGKVAWDWWNDWNISHVDFRAGINTPTYKYYIDFAAANKIEYVVLDEGWSNELDLMQLQPQIDLKEIIDYGKQKGVDIILWASWYAVNQKLDEAFAKYAAMGVKGFKIDFLDRDDQKMVKSTYEIAGKAAQYKLLVDFHGMFKPTGIQRTYPNVMNFEGVKGMENNKWTPNDDVPRYDVTIPFIRMMAGPMDYTPGAMRNATKSYFRPNNSLPMSQGTRCHQLAMYVVFEAPLQMLADNPTAYMKEQESTDFIAKVPTTFDETVVLTGKVGEHVAIARRKGETWYIGAMSNWTARDIELDFSFLGSANHEAVVFKDGINADRDATDYKKETVSISPGQKIKIHLAPGGGWAARINTVK
jgi:alpha-glucosidase